MGSTKDYNATYYQKNKVDLLLKYKVKTQCESCQKSVSKSNRSAHNKSRYHILLTQKNKDSDTE